MENKYPKILYGGDYNPNQWTRDVWLKDVELLKEAKIDTVTINVFSWAKLQPNEGTYSFSELDDIVSLLCKEKFNIVMGTSTAAMPAWLFRKYPEVARTDYQGRHHKFGRRQNACPNSGIYQKYAAALVDQLAKRYAHNSNIVCWHINNEFGGQCYCENCERAFREWLREKYRTLETLNDAWNMEFWGHNIYDWDEIVSPNLLGDGSDDPMKTCFPGMSIDYRRFLSDSMLKNYKMERDVIRKYNKEIPITTNLLGTCKSLDYFKWAGELDVISWDNYPDKNTPWSMTAMKHDLMRGLKNAPFMLMEQTPSQQNWQPYNALQRPGQMRAQSYQTIAHGADTIQFFQIRRSKGGCEKFHGAVIDHVGTNQTRVFREVKQLGLELEQLGDLTVGAVNEAEVGIVFDWDNYWGIEYSSGPSKDLVYVEQIHKYYKFFYDRNIPVNMIPFDSDFGKYKLIVAPVLYMVKGDMAHVLEEYVKNGGVLITTFMSGIVDQSDNIYLGGYPGPLKELIGVWVEEIDALEPAQRNSAIFGDETEMDCGLLCDLMHLDTAECLAEYAYDFYAGMPAVTKNQYGQGCVYYIGTDMDEAGVAKVLQMAVDSSQVSALIEERTELEVVCRKRKGEEIYFIINFKDDAQLIPEVFVGQKDVLSGQVIGMGEKLSKYDVRMIVMQTRIDNVKGERS